MSCKAFCQTFEVLNEMVLIPKSHKFIIKALWLILIFKSISIIIIVLDDCFQTAVHYSVGVKMGGSSC